VRSAQTTFTKNLIACSRNFCGTTSSP